MLRRRFQRRCHRNRCLPALPAERQHADEAHTPAGQSPGFIKNKMGGLGERFQCMAPRNQYPAPRQTSASRNQRGRCRQRQRAGARHHQQGNGHPDHAILIDKPPGDGTHRNHHQQCKHEFARDPVRHRCEPGLFFQRAVHQPHNPGNLGMLTRQLHARDQRAFAVHRPGNDTVSRFSGKGCGFSGQQRFIDGAKAFNHNAIARHRSARPDLHDITGPQRGSGHLLAHAEVGKPRQTLGDSRNQPCQPILFARRIGACVQLQIARTQQQEYKHANRVVVDRTAAVEGRPHAGSECRQDAGANRHVHVQCSRAQPAPCTAIKWIGGPGHHRQRQNETCKLHQSFDIGGHFPVRNIDGKRDHHHLHHAERSDKQTPQ